MELTSLKFCWKCKSLNRVEEWSHHWGLAVSPEKTKAMIFIMKKKKIYRQNLKLHGQEIEYTTSFKFFEVTLDKKLN